MRRAGTTLVEVLVAIFIMGIGLIAVLALFPLGVIRMAQAIQDDTTANISLNAEAMATAKLLGQDALGNRESIRHDATFLSTCQTPAGLPAASFPGSSYPVFIDPIGYWNAAGGGGGFQNWVGGGPGLTPIPRISLNFINSAKFPDKTALPWFTFRDQIVFDTNGMPSYASPGQFERSLRYSWGYLCQMPKVGDPAVVNMAVVVYNRRSLGMAAGGLPLNEYYYTSSFNTNTNVVSVTVPAGGTPPPVRPGEWILDSTPLTNPASAHGYFYRVVNITDTSGNGTAFDIEVQTPFRGFIGSNIPQVQPGIYSGQTIVLEGVVEVFERGDGRLP